MSHPTTIDVEEILEQFKKEFKYVHGEKFAYDTDYPKVVEFIRTALTTMRDHSRRAGYLEGVEAVEKAVKKLEIATVGKWEAHHNEILKLVLAALASLKKNIWEA